MRLHNLQYVLERSLKSGRNGTPENLVLQLSTHERARGGGGEGDLPNGVPGHWVAISCIRFLFHITLFFSQCF